MIASENLNLDYPENKEEVTKTENYLALSDTDTISCYTVPTPVYPTISKLTTPTYYLHTSEKRR